MKIIVAAIALAFAFPAAAQTAPAQHQGHGQPAPAQHRQHGQAQPGQHQPGQHQPGQHQPGQHQPGQHQGHEDGCCADRNNDGRMDCCERMAQAGETRGCCAEHQAGHEAHR